MSAVAATLAAVEIGRPLKLGRLALFPLFSDGPVAGPYRVTAGDDVLQVAEAGDGAEVNALDVTVAGDVPVLLLAGMILLGNLQDRAVDVPVLAPAGRTVRVPVSCVEHGRWGDRRSATRSTRHVPPTLRSRNLDAVARNVAAGIGAHGDQGEVWSSVHDYAVRFAADAPTGSLEDVHRAAADTTCAMVAGTAPLPGQRGVVAATGEQVLGVDLFDRPDVLAEHWDAIVAGYALDASETVSVRRRQVRAFLGRVARSAVASTPAAGLGTTEHVTGDDLGGVALSWDDVVVHLAAGATARDGRDRTLTVY